jgi:hypothetical protein
LFIWIFCFIFVLSKQSNMKKTPNKYQNTFDYELEPSDYDYLKEEFRVVKDSLGISLTARKNRKLSIHIGRYDIKYDNDISERRMFVATERVTLPISILNSYHEKSDDYQLLIPNTENKLISLIDEFKYRGFGNIKKEEIIEFLVAQQK